MMKPEKLKHVAVKKTCMHACEDGKVGERSYAEKRMCMVLGWLCRRKNQPRRGSLQGGEKSQK